MLTLAQRKTFQFIKQFILENQYAPTAKEIAQGIGITSRGVVHRYLKALVEKKVIALTPKRHRNISLLKDDCDETYLPEVGLRLVGAIAAGQPIEAIEQIEVVDVQSIFLGENRYALKVKGDSMIEEGIFDGDIIVCEKNSVAENGQIVVALIDAQEATLKRFQRNSDKSITLIPAHPHLSSLSYAAHRVEIQGIYIGLMRYAF